MYYYLNSKKTPTGPHSIEELCALLQQGTITMETLVAPVGGDAWKPLGTILTEATAAGEDLPPVPGIKGEVACPYCGQEFTTERKGLPEQCPHCGAELHAQSGGLWRNFALELKHCLVFRGRSTRKEYWSAVLIYYVLLMLLAIVMVVALSALELDTAIWVGVGAYAFMVLGSWLLLLGVQVRRLHDVGWSGWWVAASMLFGVGFGFAGGQYSNVYDLATSPVWRYDVNSPRVHEIAAQIAAEDDLTLSDLTPVQSYELHKAVLAQLRLEAVQSYDEAQMQSVKSPWMLLGIVVYPLGILLFVLTLLDSKRGSNKYGPSAKYPLG
ncbi:MAG: DUF805 domain-containing protein [Akkermansia sp.]|nr:DUF805 domain-containing protein [Akkermansia sp.]